MGNSRTWLLAGMLWLATIVPASAAFHFQFDQALYSIGIGDSVTVEAYLIETETSYLQEAGLKLAGIRILYNSAVAWVTSIDAAPAFDFGDSTIDNDSGSASLQDYVLVGDPVTANELGSVHLGTFHFRGVGAGSIGLTMTDIDPLNPNTLTQPVEGLPDPPGCYVLDVPSAPGDPTSIGPIEDGLATLVIAGGGAVPEPCSLLVWGGVLCAGCFFRRRRQSVL